VWTTVERAILETGKVPKDDMDEQRERASPRLREAIDRPWHRILSGNP
jgi:hypothetical protein